MVFKEQRLQIYDYFEHYDLLPKYNKLYKFLKSDYTSA